MEMPRYFKMKINPTTKEIEAVPIFSEDVAEVVRCKDCKYNYGIANNCEYAKSDIVCTLWESDGFDEFTATIRKSTSPSGAEWIVAKVNEMPSADVVEVVRCKDCKHYTTDNGGGCNKENGGLMFATETDFCSYGERKETDDRA